MPDLKGFHWLGTSKVTWVDNPEAFARMALFLWAVLLRFMA